MNWGNKLVVVFIVFGAFIGYLVYRAVNTKYDLVSKDYYKDELRYQDRIDRIKNASKLSEVQFDQDASTLKIQLPREQKAALISGEIYFYCITDERNDYHTILKVDSTNQQLLMKKDVHKGAYELKINWQEGKELYYFEKKIQIR